MKSPLLPIPIAILLVALAGSSPQGAERAAPESTSGISDSTGTVRGRVILTPSNAPAADASVIVIGTRRGAMTDDDGRFVIERVPVGRRSILLGYGGVRGHPRVEYDIGPGLNDLGEIEIPTHSLSPVEIGSHQEVQSGDLDATIEPAQRRIRVGDAPDFRVRIRNHGAATTVLASSVDASDAFASPQVKIDIEGPSGGFVVAPLVRCGNNNGIRPEDFIEVAPGEEFDPYASGWLGMNLRHGKFTKPGRYTATFRYITTEKDPRRWMGGPCEGCVLSASVHELLMRLPAVDLTATTTIEVVK